jgi:hypothetical protein
VAGMDPAANLVNVTTTTMAGRRQNGQLLHRPQE